MLAVVLCVLIFEYISIDGYVGLFIKLGVDFIITLLVIYTTGLNSSEKNYLKKIILDKLVVKRI